jgi:OOP family OmpA-OmpF porin
MVRIAALFSLVFLALACATPTKTPIAVSPTNPSGGQRVVVDHAGVVVDASGSICKKHEWPEEKALVQSFVAGMPDGSYEAGAVSFGGYARDTHTLAKLDRAGLSSWASGLSYLNNGTPLDRVFGEMAETAKGKGSKGAVVLFSDGVPTDSIGQDMDSAQALEAAKAFDAAYNGPICFHTVQIGDEAAGTQFLQQLASINGCGTHRLASSLTDAGSIGQFEREVFLGAAPAQPTPVARSVATPGDADGDGVMDDKDQCPNTPAAAKADARGCWSIPWLRFDTNKATIRPDARQRLVDEVLPVLKANPQLNIRIDGHTDARGSAQYNQSLSERRAKSVHDFLVAEGVRDSRISARGFGESKPAAPNDTKENMQINRRTELTVLE